MFVDGLTIALAEIVRERHAQDEKFGDQTDVPNGTGGEHTRMTANIARSSCQDAFANKRGTWKHILLEEYTEAMAEADPEKLRVEPMVPVWPFPSGQRI